MESGAGFLGHAFDAGARGGSSRLHAGNLGTRRSGTRGHELCRYVWLFCPALFEFPLLTLALALVLPVSKAISEREDEGEAGRRPDLKRRERESGGEVERDGQNSRTDNVCPGNIKVTD